jgi:hypothetical protein
MNGKAALSGEIFVKNRSNKPYFYHFRQLV